MTTLAKRPRRVIWMIPLLLPPLIGAGCSIGSKPDYKLGLPYREQLDFGYCGPASVLMWRLFHGYPEVSQQTILNFMGGGGCGVSPQAIASAVRAYTATSDAFWDLAGGQGDPELIQAQFISRQITSIDARVPVIPIVESGFHAGVINGGKWHTNTSSNYKTWDFVYFHDPDDIAGGANIYYSAGSWIDYSCATGTPCSQILSTSASGAWQYNLDTYGDEIEVRGRGDWPPEEWPPAY